MIPQLKNEKGSALIMITVLVVIVGIFALNIHRASIATLKMQKKDTIASDRDMVERFIRIIVSNPDLCTKLVKIDRNNQVQVNGFEFRSGKVEANRFEMRGVRYVLGNLKLATLTYDTHCPGMTPQKRACTNPGSIPLLYEQDKNGDLIKCVYGTGNQHCSTMGGVWVESAKTCDLCLGLGGDWKDGRCAFM